MEYQWRTVWISLCLTLTTLTAACTPQQQAAPNQNGGTPSPSPGPSAMNSRGPGGGPEMLAPGPANADARDLPVTMLNGKAYVPARELADALEYQLAWKPASGRIDIGDYGPDWTLKVGAVEATKGDKPIKLDAPPLEQGGKAYLPVSSLSALFDKEARFREENGRVRMDPAGSGTADKVKRGQYDLAEATGTAPSFKDDPNDPFKDASVGPVDGQSVSMGESGSALTGASRREQAVPAAAAGSIDMGTLLTTAKRYLGVPYEFGTEPYPSSNRFDCSTFTDYIFSKFGINLPRTARAQGELGREVSRDSLRRGDLLFFYVPGRFRTDRTIGHVGIYMGNGQMIHACPLPKDGVQITNIEKPYWQETFIKAVRLAP